MEEEIRNVSAPEEAEDAGVVEDAVIKEVETVDAAETEVTAESREEPGNIRISVDVVSTIAGIATNETPGVAGMYGTFAGGIAEMLGAKKSPTKGVKVDMDGKNVIIDLYIVVDYGVRIPELAWEIQESVKNNVETMTGLDVQKVNIHIEGVSFEKDKSRPEPQPEPDIPEQPEENPEEITD